MKEFHQMREEFHPHKLLWLGYLVYSLGNYAMKLCIETALPKSSRVMFGGAEKTMTCQSF